MLNVISDLLLMPILLKVFLHEDRLGCSSTSLKFGLVQVNTIAYWVLEV
jgi:hypothetical protein